MENGCRLIGFPLISAGIFGYPLRDAWKKAFDACYDFLDRNANSSLDIVFAVLDDKIIETGHEVLRMHAASQYMAADRNNRKTVPVQDKLTVSGHVCDAVFFHLPQEPNGYLGNWYISPFDLDGISFSSTEQYIMYRKCMLFGDESSAGAVLATYNPETQQTIGRNSSGYIHNVWSKARQIILLRGLWPNSARTKT